MARRVLITGAAGFIGGACVREFLANGWEVVALVHRSIGAELEALSAAGRVKLTRGSITDGLSLRAALADERGHLDAVIHAAGLASDIGRDRDFRESHLTGTGNVASCVRDLELGRLIYVSTTDVYGLHDFRAADESTPLEPQPCNPYPKYKILAEREIGRALPAGQYVFLRPGAVWGPGDRTILPRVLSYLRSTPAIVHFGRWHGKNRWPLAHVTNVARAAVAAASESRVAVTAYNVIDPERTSIDEYYRLLIDALIPQKRGVRSVTLPYCCGWIIGCVSTMISRLARENHPLFEPSLYGLQSISADLDFDVQQVLALLSRHNLGLVSRSAGLRELAQSYRPVFPRQPA